MSGISTIENDFSLCVATVNGSGSQTANSVLLKALFRMGIPIGGKNVFPSNISGLPTWFWIRASDKGYLGSTKKANVVVSVNAQTQRKDYETVKSGGVFFTHEPLKENQLYRDDIIAREIPLKSLSEKIQTSPKMKKLASNMIYVGVLAELLGIPEEIVCDVITQILSGKVSAIETNQKALEIGMTFARESLGDLQFPFRAKASDRNVGKILMDGNTAAALGLISGGCQIISWYPITPSTSLVESFIKYAEKMRTDDQGKNRFSVVQAEDELAAFSMVLGAGWAGTRALTATSGPGLSLMSEGAGYAYYAEIPSVIWNVQRLGPSTGLPTRTAQGDVLSAAFLSHGEARHILLFPADLTESFDFGQICFDLAEKLQQLVIVLSDLDLGMNLWMSDTLKPLADSYVRGFVVSEEQTKEYQRTFRRYSDWDGNGVPPRTILGNRDPHAAYFTRGSGHNQDAQYSESEFDYEENITRLKKKFEYAREVVPRPIVKNNGSRYGLVYYGSTSIIVDELSDLLKVPFNLCRIRAFPFSKGIQGFIDSCEKVFVIEQNRDGQMKSLLAMDMERGSEKLKSILHFDGTPISAESIAVKIEREIQNA